uniref:Type I restriction enzyme R protein N terminus (HSDR_N) n=1 Tax=Candidatus Kentrum sp. MB TaxID=2138164 RepID=A0A451BGL3_9GAMM|nr:MAG: hypothetical protein BECKMB1821G_GA0114241_11312 [Candidatus Kentron sp. MB]VFK35682.1 MAG: hypothetical protein BECKMB1821I_GA0114274_11372 [Candidatus Kentron sp. MB]VFK77434.1 MAG: hypothetical protein BECKMB1821H_GA0114242_11382 [Candidatus Kentron sp. MB]
MTSDKKEVFSDFDFANALEFLDLFPYQKWQLEIEPISPSDALTVNLKRAERQVTSDSNEWEQRLFMELVFLEALENHDIRMWQEKSIDAGNAPFRGKVDFVFTSYRASFKSPYVVLSEAKRDDFDKGWGQCLMAIKAAHLLNTQEGHRNELYGIVTSGRIWEFGKYTLDNQFHKTGAYSLEQPDVLLGILHSIFGKCEKQARMCKNTGLLKKIGG